ncbi:FixH family protein [Flavobacterium caeni]|uniref:FixH protein n=1 Tax=Flavobacterium caeni TaxID=490189 RepID=A0A1G5CYF1_9FLAO|nr:FixH family protein [Flavobacterium caeni]SCY07442.1 FixH protein [Flavobacterium caeni]
MKLNWGTSIVIAFGAFIAFIGYFIVKVQSNSAYDNELVVEEYYKKDAAYSAEFNKFQNAQSLSLKPTIVKTQAGVLVTFPKKQFPKTLEGKVSLYRPSAKKLDFEHPFQTQDSTLLIPKQEFAGGNWDIVLYWIYDGKEYLLKQKMYL